MSGPEPKLGGHEVAMALRAAYLSLHRQADAHFARYKLTANQFVILSLLAQQDQVQQRDLVRRASSDPNTIRPVIIALEQKGLLSREQHPDDGRAWFIRLTPRGRRLFERLESENARFHQLLLDGMGPGEPEQLVASLQRIVTSMQNMKQEMKSSC